MKASVDWWCRSQNTGVPAPGGKQAFEANPFLAICSSCAEDFVAQTADVAHLFDWVLQPPTSSCHLVVRRFRP